MCVNGYAEFADKDNIWKELKEAFDLSRDRVYKRSNSYSKSECVLYNYINHLELRLDRLRPFKHRLHLRGFHDISLDLQLS